MATLPPSPASGSVEPLPLAARLAAIVESSDDAIIGKDLNSVIKSWNRGAEKIFGYTAAEMIGSSILRLIPENRQQEETFILEQIRRGEAVKHFETQRLAKDGRLLDVSVTASPIRDGIGRVVGVSKIARDITMVKLREREIARLSRLYAALSQVNQAIVMMPTREALFDKVCHALIAFGGFRLAWIGGYDPATHTLLPRAVHGDGADSIQAMPVSSGDRPEARGPSSTAFRENRRVISNQLPHDATALPWRDDILRHGFEAVAAFPIRCGGAAVGVLTVYSDERDFFRDKEVALLEEAAGDISFGLDNFARDEERRIAEEKVREERDFSAALLYSQPGVLYLYDEAGRFLRWNRNFEQVTGYTAAEITAMHPLNFFDEADRDLVATRIAEVFAEGKSTVEAMLLTKAGGAIPYYFTGVRTSFDGKNCLIGVGIDISARRQAEAARRESEERFNAFMDATPALAWMTDAEGRHLFMNRAWDAAFGLHGADWLGKTAGDLVPPAIAEKIRQSDLQVLAEDRAIEIPEEEGFANGKAFCWSLVKFPFRNAAGQRFIGGIAIDITARKQADAARRASEERYRTLFDHAPDGILIADAESVYLDANASICRMLGYNREELVGLHASDIVAPSETRKIGPALDTIQARSDYHREWQFRRKDGTLFPAEVIATLMPDGKMLGMVRDITERKRAEQALRELNESLERRVAERTAELQVAVQRAEDADRVKSAFLATMSHELRTPLNSIIGFTGIVLQGLAGPLNEEQSKQLGMVRGSARHLLELINDVLDLSKIEAEQLEVIARPFDLAEALGRVVASVRPLAEKKGLELVARFSPGSGTMTSDRRRVDQIVLNLLNNAIKFTEAGRVTFTADAIADFRPTPDAAPVPAFQLRVTDTGIGIKAEDLASLFQPFRQLDSGLARQHEGTGLGLAICRRLATLLGGEISARSEWSRGSEFTVVLPREKPSAP